LVLIEEIEAEIDQYQEEEVGSKPIGVAQELHVRYPSDASVAT
jgi:hypothetical protein